MDSGEAAPSLRRADRIAPEENRLAIRTVLKEAAAATKSEVATAVARTFGFERTGNDLDVAIVGRMADPEYDPHSQFHIGRDLYENELKAYREEKPIETVPGQ